MKVSIQKTDKLLNRLAGALILVASILFTGCPNKITVKPETFAVTFGAGDHGTVEASVDGKALTSGSVVQKDKTVDFTAKPKDSIYEVEKWTVSGGKFEAKGQPGDTTAKVKVTTETTVTVTFKSKTVPVEKITVTVQSDEKVTVQEPKTFQVDKRAVWKTVKNNVKVTYKDGYELSNWKLGNKDGTALTDEYVFTENTTVFAVSKLQGDYSITYHFDDGKNDAANPTSYNIETETITFKPAIRIGYTFKGWFNNEAYTGDAVTQIAKGNTGNKEFWAKWEANKYKLHFDGNGADSGSMSDQLFTYDKEQALTENTFIKTGYIFAGWKDGDDTTYTDKQSVKNLTAKQNGTVTLYAQWQINKYSVIFEVVGGNGVLKAKVKESGSEITSGVQVAHGQTIVFTAEPKDNDFVVGQWTLNETVVSEIDGHTMCHRSVAENMKVTIRFIHKEAGLIILKDGTYRTKRYHTIDSSNPPVAVIAGKMGKKYIGIALHVNKQGLAWAKKGSHGFNRKFEGIQDNNDTDGSDNWEYIKSIDSAGTADAATNYPAFNWVNSYNSTYSSQLGEKIFDWYMPSLAELSMVYKNSAAINTSLKVIRNIDDTYADESLGLDWYWSSSQNSNYTTNASVIYFNGFIPTHYNGRKKYDSGWVCCIAVF